MARGNASRMARTWTRKAFRLLKRGGAPTRVAKAGANSVGKAAYKLGQRKRKFRKGTRRRRNYGRKTRRRY